MRSTPQSWEDYEHAINDMVTRTSTENAAWTLVPGNDKRNARVHVLKTFVEKIGAAVG